MLNDFQLVGRDLCLTGLNNSHSGNLSVRQGDRIIITRTVSMLGYLEFQSNIGKASAGPKGANITGGGV